MKKILSLTLMLAILLVIVGCGNKKPKSSNADLSFSSTKKDFNYSFLSNDTTQTVKINKNSSEQFERTVSNISLDYKFVDLYGVFECYERIFTKSFVTKHKHSALDENGQLTADHLKNIVKENNKRFLEEKKTGKGFYKEADDKFLLSLCQLIVDTISSRFSVYQSFAMMIYKTAF